MLKPKGVNAGRLHKPPEQVQRLLASKVPYPINPEFFYEQLRSNLNTESAENGDGQHHSQDHTTIRRDVIKNALLLRLTDSLMPNSADHDTSTSSSPPTQTSMQPAVAAAPLPRKICVAFVDITDKVLAEALVRGDASCVIQGQRLQWKFLGPVARRDDNNEDDSADAVNRARRAADQERVGREAYMRALTGVHSMSTTHGGPASDTAQKVAMSAMASEATHTIRLCTKSSPRTVRALYGDVFTRAVHSTSSSGSGSSATPDGEQTEAGPCAVPDALSRLPASRHPESSFLSFYTDVQHALRELLGHSPSNPLADGAETLAEFPYVLDLQILSHREIHMRVPHAAAVALRQLGTRPWHVPHYRHSMPSHMNPSACSALTPSAPSSDLAVRAVGTTVWFVEPVPRRRVDALLLAQVAEGDANSTPQAPFSAASVRHTINLSPTGAEQAREEEEEADAARKRRQRIDPAESAEALTDVRRTRRVELTAGAFSHTQPLPLRLASKAEVLMAMAAMMTATSGHVAALQDEYGNLCFLPPAEL